MANPVFQSGFQSFSANERIPWSIIPRWNDKPPVAAGRKKRKRNSCLRGNFPIEYQLNSYEGRLFSVLLLCESLALQPASSISNPAIFILNKSLSMRIGFNRFKPWCLLPKTRDISDVETQQTEDNSKRRERRSRTTVIDGKGKAEEKRRKGKKSVFERRVSDLLSCHDRLWQAI